MEKYESLIKKYKWQLGLAALAVLAYIYREDIKAWWASRSKPQSPPPPPPPPPPSTGSGSRSSTGTTTAPADTTAPSSTGTPLYSGAKENYDLVLMLTAPRMKNKEVKSLQFMLNSELTYRQQQASWSPNDPVSAMKPIAEDGDFGRSTEARLFAFLGVKKITLREAVGSLQYIKARIQERVNRILSSDSNSTSSTPPESRVTQWIGSWFGN